MRAAKTASTKVMVSLRLALAGGLLALVSLAAGCSASAASTAPASASSAARVTLNVSAAASLKGVLTSVAPAFEKATGSKVAVNYGASGVLLKQIEGGTPTDVFLSASPSQINTLTAEGLASVDATETFAGNDLVILVPAGNPKGIHGPADLAKATRLTTGDPKVAPHGAKAQEWLTRLGFWEALQPKFVFASNAAQTDDYIARGEVDAGIGFASDAKGRSDLQVVYTVPAGQIKPVRYVGVPVRSAAQPELARKFLAYLLTPSVQSAFADAGFKPASAK